MSTHNEQVAIQTHVRSPPLPLDGVLWSSFRASRSAVVPSSLVVSGHLVVWRPSARVPCATTTSRVRSFLPGGGRTLSLMPLNDQQHATLAEWFKDIQRANSVPVWRGRLGRRGRPRDCRTRA